MLTSNTMRFGTDIFGLAAETDGDATGDGGSSSGDGGSSSGDGGSSSGEGGSSSGDGGGSSGDGGSSSGDGGSTTSTVAFVKKALLVSKTAFDCTNATSVTGFVVSGTQPADTARRFMFQIDGKNYYFNSSTLVEYTKAITANNVLKTGNTAAQLTALSNITGFVGKKIFPIIALKSTSSTEDVPTVKLQLKITVPNDVLTKEAESIVYELVDDDSTPRIVECSSENTLTGNGSVTTKIRLRTDDTWTAYMDLQDAIDKEAQAVQFKNTYKVTKTDGTDSAKVDSATVDYTLGKAVVADGNANLYTVVADYENELSMCYVVVKHEPLNDSRIDAYVNFLPPPKTRTLIAIGTGNGSRKEMVLGVNSVADTNIISSTLELYRDGVQISDFSFNSETSTVTLTTKKNSLYSASYKYDYGQEVWRKMTLEETEPFNDESGTVTSRFSYTLPAGETASTSNVRLNLVRPTGTVKNYSLGTSTGKTQLFVLPHVAKMSTIKFNPDIGADNWDFDADTHVLTLVATPKGTALNVSYSWTGESIIIYSVVCGWTV